MSRVGCEESIQVTMVLALAVVPALFRSIVARNMTGSATRLTVGVQGRSLSSMAYMNRAWTQMSMPLLNVLYVG